MKYLLLLVAFLTIPLTAKASEFTVGNLLIVEKMNAGETKTFTVDITNTQTSPLKVDIVIRELLLKPGSGLDFAKIKEGKEKNPKSLVNNVKVPEKSYVVQPKQTVKIPLIVTLPDNYVGTGVFSFTIQDNPDFGIEFAKGRTAAIAIEKRWTGYAAITEKKSKTNLVQFKDFSIAKNGLATLLVENIGSKLSQLSGYIIAVDKNGKQVSKINLTSRKNLNSVRVFPGYTNSMIVAIPLKDPTKYKYLVTVKNDEERFYYTKSLELKNKIEPTEVKPPVKKESTKKK